MSNNTNEQTQTPLPAKTAESMAPTRKRAAKKTAKTADGSAPPAAKKTAARKTAAKKTAKSVEAPAPSPEPASIPTIIEPAPRAATM